jgi:uncharacterized protein (TIGR01777 family)
MKVLLTGATGFLGLELIKRLPEAVTEIRVLSRDAGRADETLTRALSPTRFKKCRSFNWDAEGSVAPATALEDIDVVIHLAGENVGAGRWSDETKRRIRSSRELGTRNLVQGLNLLSRPPVLISASAIGIYGNAGETVLTETSPAGPGFLAEICRIWEFEAAAAKVARLVTPRFGVVLGPDGGAMAKLLPLFRAGIGGRIGDGKQWMSWIHRDDVLTFLLSAMTDPKISGVYNVVAPEPVRNETFAHTLGHVLHRPSLLAVPAVAVKLALGEMAEETVLTSQRISAEKLAASGIPFAYPSLEGALQQITAP